jgi:hypothetical protein
MAVLVGMEGRRATLAAKRKVYSPPYDQSWVLMVLLMGGTEMKKVIIALGMAALFTSHAIAETSILRTLPLNVQNDIERVRQTCREYGSATSGYNLPKITDADNESDWGFRAFTVSGQPAALVDELGFCGLTCMHSINCATGFTHSVAIYVRYGNVWRKSFSVDATEPIFLSIEPYGTNFRALVLSVHAGWDLGCPVHSTSGDAWKREKCDFVVKWDGTRFVHKLL